MNTVQINYKTRPRLAVNKKNFKKILWIRDNHPLPKSDLQGVDLVLNRNVQTSDPEVTINLDIFINFSLFL